MAGLLGDANDLCGHISCVAPQGRAKHSVLGESEIAISLPVGHAGHHRVCLDRRASLERTLKELRHSGLSVRNTRSLRLNRFRIRSVGTVASPANWFVTRGERDQNKTAKRVHDD